MWNCFFSKWVEHVANITYGKKDLIQLGIIAIIVWQNVVVLMGTRGNNCTHTKKRLFLRAASNITKKWKFLLYFLHFMEQKGEIIKRRRSARFWRTKYTSWGFRNQRGRNFFAWIWRYRKFAAADRNNNPQCEGEKVFFLLHDGYCEKWHFLRNYRRTCDSFPSYSGIMYELNSIVLTQFMSYYWQRSENPLVISTTRNFIKGLVSIMG